MELENEGVYNRRKEISLLRFQFFSTHDHYTIQNNK